MTDEKLLLSETAHPVQMCRCQHKEARADWKIAILGTFVLLLSVWCFRLNNDVGRLKLAFKELAEIKNSNPTPNKVLVRNSLTPAYTDAEATHSVVRRTVSDPTADETPPTRKKRGGKKRIPKEIRRQLKKNRAIAIHVQAQGEGLGGRFRPELVEGRILNNWARPDRRFRGFDTAHLHDDGFFTVPVTGAYFVYSQVVFNVTNHPFMTSEIGVNVEGQTTFSKCQFSNPYTMSLGRKGASSRKKFVTCHSNGVVFMRAREGISISVNPPSVEVYLQPQFTYFGAFLIGL
uniref:THD domain-containing protein n=1 Tax=Ciona savignyi TaxID=51511 RepID=H2Z4E9_CIOSA